MTPLSLIAWYHLFFSSFSFLLYKYASKSGKSLASNILLPIGLYVWWHRSTRRFTFEEDEWVVHFLLARMLYDMPLCLKSKSLLFHHAYCFGACVTALVTRDEAVLHYLVASSVAEASILSIYLFLDAQTTGRYVFYMACTIYFRFVCYAEDAWDCLTHPMNEIVRAFLLFTYVLFFFLNVAWTGYASLMYLRRQNAATRTVAIEAEKSDKDV